MVPRRFLGSAAAARQSDATAKAQARRATQRRSLKDARTQKRVQRNLDYHIARLEGETRRMSTEGARRGHLKRVEANHRRAAARWTRAGFWSTRRRQGGGGSEEAERRRRRERRFAPSGASVKASARRGERLRRERRRGSGPGPRGRWAPARRRRRDVSRPSPGRRAPRRGPRVALERDRAVAGARARRASERGLPAPGAGEELAGEVRAPEDGDVSREAETRRGAPPGGPSRPRRRNPRVGRPSRPTDARDASRLCAGTTTD